MDSPGLASPTPKAEESGPKPYVLVDPTLEPNWVTLDLKLRNWSFSGLAFKVRLRVDTPVFAIKRKIVERHGRLSKLTLYKDAETPDCEILNDRLTLAELGILGRPLHDPPEVVVLHYDFKPFAHDEPVLLAEHRRADADLAEDEALKAKLRGKGAPALAGRTASSGTRPPIAGGGGGGGGGGGLRIGVSGVGASADPASPGSR